MGRGDVRAPACCGNALFYGRMPNDGQPYRDGPSGWAARGERCAAFCRVRSISEYPLPDSQAIEGRRADGDGG